MILEVRSKTTEVAKLGSPFSNKTTIAIVVLLENLMVLLPLHYLISTTYYYILSLFLLLCLIYILDVTCIYPIHTQRIR